MQKEKQKKVIIIGASGHGRVIADIIKSSGDKLIGFLDDDLSIQGNIIYDDKLVLGTITEENIKKYKDYYFIIGIGSNKVRKLISSKYSKLKWYTGIHPNAVIGSNVTIGVGTVIMAGTVINTGTIIGKHCILNTCSSLDHDNIIEDFVHVSPGAHLAGTVKIGSLTWIGAGGIVINNISIGKNNIIGAGSVVIRNIYDNDSTFIGVPAKKIEK